MQSKSILDLGNVSFAIGSWLISGLTVFVFLFLFLCLPPVSLFVSPHLTHALGSRDNSYVLRMHNVPNYFTLLLLRVINALRLARERVYPVSSTRDLLPRDYESPRDLPTSFSVRLTLSISRSL